MTARDRAALAIGAAMVAGGVICLLTGEPTAPAGRATGPLSAEPTTSWPLPHGMTTSAGPAARMRVIRPARPVGVVALPVSLDIPAIGVRTSLTSLGRTASGALEVPGDTVHAGWYRFSARPGAVGPSVIVGHVDSRTGPGVFYSLGHLRPGDKITVRRTDASTATFQVTQTATYPKSHLPATRIYGPTPDRALRLITCGGAFDSTAHAYRSNVVVYATTSP